MKIIIYFFIVIVNFFSWSVFALNPDTKNNFDPELLHVQWFDPRISPAQNFYNFANGGWQRMNPIPSDYARWSIINSVQENNQRLIKGILEQLLKQNNPHGSDAQKIADFYYSGMDKATIERMGVTPLNSEMALINSINNLTTLQKVMAHLQIIGTDAVFDFGQMQDFKNSNRVIGVAYQDGLSLPDRDYYLLNGATFQKVRDIYVQHLTNIFKLLGDSSAQAAAEAKIVLAIETTMAQASVPRATFRDPHAVYHMMDLSQLNAITPHFSWQQFFSDVGHPEIHSINLANPQFFKSFNTQLQQVPLDHWKIYLRWQLIHAFAPYLSNAFVQENFRLAKALTGVAKLQPQWKRVLQAEDDALGFAVGRFYVEKYFPPTAKAQAIDMLHHIRNALKSDLQTLSWMTPQMRQLALKKLALMGERIGYPDRWRDYSSLQIDRGPYVLNVLRADEFYSRRELNKIGKPVDRTEWAMTPQTVNAYYDASMNELNVPAGILQSPFFDPKAPPALNFGGIGAVMGHEMTHAFDDTGAQFDGHGNLKNWWTKEDLQKFHAATQCIANQFSQYTVGGTHVRGSLVVGEATADLGGLTLAFRSFQNSPYYSQAPTIKNFSPDQQFFISWAHFNAGNIRLQEALRLIITDPHPPAIYRVNGSVANMSGFQQAFHIPDGSPMVNANRCKIW